MYQSIVRRSRSRRAGALLAAALAAGLLGAQAAAKNPISVVVDQAKLIRVDKPAHTVIVGNPSIADATVYDANTLVITGRAFGTTNLIVLDAQGNPITDELLSVTPAQTTTVQVHRRAARFSYSCNPNCAPTLSPGDFKEHFDKLKGQFEARHQMSKNSATNGN